MIPKTENRHPKRTAHRCDTGEDIRNNSKPTASGSLAITKRSGITDGTSWHTRRYSKSGLKRVPKRKSGKKESLFEKIILAGKFVINKKDLIFALRNRTDFRNRRDTPRKRSPDWERGVAQSGSAPAWEQGVVGSNPATPTKKPPEKDFLRRGSKKREISYGEKYCSGCSAVRLARQLREWSRWFESISPTNTKP